MRRGLRAAVWACALVACAQIDATATRYADAPRLAATDAAKVQVLRSDPGKPYQALGDIEVDAATDPAPPIEQIEAKLRSEAAAMGADAVVVVMDRVSVLGSHVMAGYRGRAYTVDARRVVGVAIRYR